MLHRRAVAGGLSEGSQMTPFLESLTNVSKVIRILILISAWTTQVLSDDRKESGGVCGQHLASVRMEVPPVLLQVICSNTNSTTLVVDCGSNLRYENVAGFCSSSELNIGQVLMDQHLVSSTITLQLLKSGQILDAAKIAILSSEHLVHYRISVWGNRNTRFVLTIAQECNPYEHNDSYAERLNHLPQQFPETSSHNILPIQVDNQSPDQVNDSSQNLSQPRVANDEISKSPEYIRPNKFGKSQPSSTDSYRSRYLFMKTRLLQPEVKNTSLNEDQATKIEIYRSKLPKFKDAAWIDPILQTDAEDSEVNVRTTTPESSELAKLRWMEEKRILFEQKMKFFRNFYPETVDSLTSDTETLSIDYAEEQTDVNVPNPSDTTEKFIRSLDSHKIGNGSGRPRYALRQNENDILPNLPPGSEIQSSDYQIDSPEDEARMLESPSLQMNEKDTPHIKQTKLNFRRLDSSNVFVRPTKHAKLEHTKDVQHLNRSILVSEKAEILRPYRKQEDLVNQSQEYSSTSTQPSNIKLDLMEFKTTNSNSIKIAEEFTNGQVPSTESMQPLNLVGKSVQDRQTIPQSIGSTVSFSHSVINISNVDHIYPTSVSRDEDNLQTSYETVPISSFVQLSTNSPKEKSRVPESDTQDGKQSSDFHESLATLPVTLRTLLLENTSQRQVTPRKITAKPAETTVSGRGVAIQTTPSTNILTQLLLSVNKKNVFVRSTFHLSYDGIRNSLNENITSTSEIPSISPFMNSLKTQIEISKTPKANISQTDNSLRSTIRSASADISSTDALRFVSLRAIIQSARMSSTDASLRATIKSASTNSSSTEAPSLKSTINSTNILSTEQHLRNTIKSIDANSSLIDASLRATLKSTNTYISSTDASLRATIKLLNTSISPTDTSLRDSVKSPSTYISTTKFSKAEEPPIQSRHVHDDDTKVSQLPSITETGPNREHDTTHLPSRESTTSSQWETNLTPLRSIQKVKVLKILRAAAQSFTEQPVSTVQKSSIRPEAEPRNAAVPLMQDGNADDLLQQNADTSTIARSQPYSTASGQAQTSESLEVPKTSGATINAGTSQASDDEHEDMEKDSFWPIVAALVIGVPAVVVVGIAITMIYRKRLEEPALLVCQEAASASLHPSH